MNMMEEPGWLGGGGAMPPQTHCSPQISIYCHGFIFGPTQNAKIYRSALLC